MNESEPLQTPLDNSARDPDSPRPRWLVFAVLAVLWFFPSAGAVYILFFTRPSRGAGGDGTSWLGAIRLEDYIAAALLLVHAIFVWMALSRRRSASVTVELPAKNS